MVAHQPPRTDLEKKPCHAARPPAAIALSIATAGVPHPALADDAASAAVAMTRPNASTLCKTDPSSDLGASDQKVFSEERHRRIVSKWTKSTNDTSGGE